MVRSRVLDCSFTDDVRSVVVAAAVLVVAALVVVIVDDDALVSAVSFLSFCSVQFDKPILSNVLIDHLNTSLFIVTVSYVSLLPAILLNRPSFKTDDRIEYFPRVS